GGGVAVRGARRPAAGAGARRAGVAARVARRPRAPPQPPAAVPAADGRLRGRPGRAARCRRRAAAAHHRPRARVAARRSRGQPRAGAVPRALGPRRRRRRRAARARPVGRDRAALRPRRQRPHRRPRPARRRRRAVILLFQSAPGGGGGGGDGGGPSRGVPRAPGVGLVLAGIVLLWGGFVWVAGGRQEGLHVMTFSDALPGEVRVLLAPFGSERWDVAFLERHTPAAGSTQAEWEIARTEAAWLPQGFDSGPAVRPVTLRGATYLVQ